MAHSAGRENGKSLGICEEGSEKLDCSVHVMHGVEGFDKGKWKSGKSMDAAEEKPGIIPP